MEVLAIVLQELSIQTMVFGIKNPSSSFVKTCQHQQYQQQSTVLDYQGLVPGELHRQLTLKE